MYDDIMLDFVFPALFGLLMLVIVGLFCGLPFFVWKSAAVSAEIYNAQNGTHYTTRDFFWAGDQINAQTQTVKLQTN